MASNRIYIGKLSNQARERDVERFFKGYGRIQRYHAKERLWFRGRLIFFLDQNVMNIFT